MTAKKTVSPAHVSHAAAPAVTPSATTPSALPLIALAPPPADAVIPPVPSDYVSKSGATYRNVAPRKTELLVLAQAVNNLAEFTSYTQTMGAAAPPYAATLALFRVVYQWSSMRTSSSAWERFCVDQEGLGWATLRPVMATLRPLLEASLRADPTLALRLPALMRLFGARKAIALKGAATQRRNREAKAKGKPQAHGKAGKARTREAEKAALRTLERQQAQASTAPGSATAGHTGRTGQTEPATVTTAPVVAS